MGNIIKLSVILGLITCIAAAGLAMVNSITKPKILEQRRLATLNALKVVLPGAKDGIYEPIDEKGTCFIGYADAEKTQIAGYAYKALGKGYSSTIETLVGVNDEGTIQAVSTLFQQETPGLGTKVETDKFKNQFQGKKASAIKVDKDGGPITAITGATISSRAVSNSIRNDYQNFLNVLEAFKAKAPEAKTEHNEN